MPVFLWLWNMPVGNTAVLVVLPAANIFERESCQKRVLLITCQTWWAIKKGEREPHLCPLFPVEDLLQPRKSTLPGTVHGTVELRNMVPLHCGSSVSQKLYHTILVDGYDYQIRILLL